MEKMKVPFGTIDIPDRARALINEALDSRRVSGGRLVHEFEEKFAELLGVREAVAVSTGTDADTLALALLHDINARRGDEVIVPALSFVATGNAVLHAGFEPAFVDIDRRTLNIDPARIEAAITEKTRAIMPVHLMGKPADMDAIMSIAEKHKLYVIEDAAEAHGGFYKNRALGTIGELGAFSTYVAHIITTIEGGVIITNREDHAEILRSLRAHGRACTCKKCLLNTEQAYCLKRFLNKDIEDIRFHFERVGYSSKMNELEAAVGLGNLDNYQQILDKRYRNLKYVLARFEKFEPFLFSIKEEPHEKIGPHAIPIMIGDEASFKRKDLINHLETHGIETRTLFDSMPTRCPGFAYRGYRYGEFPEAEYIGRNGIHIGTHHALEIEHMEYVIETLTGFLEKHQI